MAFDNSFTAVTGSTLAAADWNTYVKGNFTAVWVGTTAGDTEYYTSSTAKTRLAIGSAYTVKYSTGSAPAWGAVSTILANAAAVSSQAANDLIKASSSTALARIALGASHTFVKSDGSSVGYGPITYRRQGGSSTVWSTAGTSNYTPTKDLVQRGVISVSVSVGVGSASVTFPTSYTYAPHVTGVLYYSIAKDISAPLVYSISTTGFSVRVVDPVSDTFTVDFAWVAHGE